MSVASSVAVPAAVSAPRRDTAVALFLLVCADLVVSVLPFRTLYAMVRSCPRVGRVDPSRHLERARALCESMQRARAWYFKRAWCLQAASAAVPLLRLRGIPADLVIGVRKLPFRSHAWVEVDGDVVLNNREGLRTVFREMVRC